MTWWPEASLSGPRLTKILPILTTLSGSNIRKWTNKWNLFNLNCQDGQFQRIWDQSGLDWAVKKETRFVYKIATICRIFDKYFSSPTPIDLHQNRNILCFSLEKMKPYVDKDKDCSYIHSSLNIHYSVLDLNCHIYCTYFRNVIQTCMLYVPLQKRSANMKKRIDRKYSIFLIKEANAIDIQ